VIVEVVCSIVSKYSTYPKSLYEGFPASFDGVGFVGAPIPVVAKIVVSNYILT
jgi:hypothetical protein